MWLFTPNWLTCERQRSWDWATLPRCTSSSVTVLVCTFIESQSEMLLLFVTFVHKGKHRAAACRRKDLSERLHFCFNQELVVTATCGGFFLRRRDVLWLMWIKSGSQPCVLLKCPWASFWIPNSCENAVLCLNFDLWPLSVEKWGRVRTFFSLFVQPDCFCSF